MKTEHVRKIEVHTVLLEEDIDYQAADLIPGFYGSKVLPNEKLQEIAKSHLFDRCCWSGAIFPDNPNQHGFRAQFERTLKG